MPKLYTKEEFWKLYKILPEDLKEVIFADETGDNTYNICQRNGIIDKLDAVVDYVGEVLLGILPPEKLQTMLEKELNLDSDSAKNVAREIDRIIFYPVRYDLEKIYHPEVVQPSGSSAGIPQGASPKPDKNRDPLKDRYLEPIENEKI